jgi:Ca-activated chloride channel homolog
MRRLAAALAMFLLGAAVHAQDLTPRKGFSVRITQPKSDEIVYGEVMIRAEATAPHEQDVAHVDFYVDDKLILADTEPPYQVVFNFGKQSPSHVIRVVAHHRDGPLASDFVITRGAQFQYVVNVQRVVLDVSVRDEKRRVVTGLSAADFLLVEENRPQTLLSVSPERRPVLVGVLLDTSGSMRERMKEAQEAACRFTAALDAPDRAFVVDFDEQITLLADATGDREALCAAIRTTTAVGGTALWDAVHAAFRVIHESPAERRAFVILSDGDDTESRLKFDKILEEARLNDVTIYTIGLDVGALSDARRHLGQLAEQTGGRSFFVKKADELNGTYDQIAEELRTLYQLVYSSDNKVYDGRFVKIKIGAPAHPEYDVRSRSGYNASQP